MVPLAGPVLAQNCLAETLYYSVAQSETRLLRNCPAVLPEQLLNRPAAVLAELKWLICSAAVLVQMVHIQRHRRQPYQRCSGAVSHSWQLPALLLSEEIPESCKSDCSFRHGRFSVECARLTSKGSAGFCSGWEITGEAIGFSPSFGMISLWVRASFTAVQQTSNSFFSLSYLNSILVGWTLTSAR